MSILTRIKSLWGPEGSQRGPFYGQGEQGGWYELGSIEDGFQRNLELPDVNGKNIPAAYAAVMANARAVSQCLPKHIRTLDDGNRETQMSSAVSRIFRRPNNYETFSQYILNCVAQMLFDGESFSLATRDEAGNVIRLDRMESNSCVPHISEGELFYAVGNNPFIDEDPKYMVPGRDVLHLRFLCPRHPLIGESPIKAAALSAGVNVALSRSQAAFFTNMSRPSGIITTGTDQLLNKEQMASLREAWQKQSQRMNQGQVPILSGNLKFQPMGITSQDAQMAEAQRLSIEDIARVFGVPLPVIGDMSNSTLSNAETLVQMWLSISLGSLLENLEQSFTNLFNLPAEEKVELDVTGLLRTDFLSRVDGLSRAVMGGIYTVNEARGRENLGPVENGDVPIVQQQMVPLGWQEAPSPEPVEVRSAEENVVDITQFRKWLND